MKNLKIIKPQKAVFILLLIITGSCSENIIQPPLDPGGNGSHAWSQFGFDARLSGNPYGPQVEIPPFYGSNIVWEVNLGRGDIHGNHCIDSKGNIYIRFSSGTNPDTCYILKFNKSGELIWKNIYEGMIHNTEGGNSLSADEKTLYVASYTGLFSIDSSGVLNWVVYDNNVTYSQASKPAIDKNGNIFIVLGAYDLYSISPSGIVNWTYRNNNYGNPSIDSKGNVYVPYGHSSTDKGVLKISSGGELEFKLTLEGIPFKINIDKEDNIYIIYYTCPGGCGKLESYDNSGNFRWQKEVNLFEPGHSFSLNSSIISREGLVISLGWQSDGQNIFFRGIMAFNNEGDSVFSFSLVNNGYPEGDTYRLTKDSHDNIYYYLRRTSGSGGFNSLGAIDIKGNSIFETQSTPGFDALSPEGGFITTFRSNSNYYLQFRK